MWCKEFICHIILAAAYGLQHLGSLFYQNTVFTSRVIFTIYYCVIFHKTRCYEQAHISLGNLYTVSFLWPREENRLKPRRVDDFAGHRLLWRLVLRLLALLYLTKNNFLTSLASAPDSAVSNQNFTIGFLKCYFFPGIARYPQSSALFRLLCMTEQFQKHNISDMDMFYSDSKTDLKIKCDCCIKIPAISGCPTCCY